MLEARAVKNEDEIACLKMIAAIADAVWFRVWESLRPGMRYADIGAVASAAGYEFGAEFSVPGGWRSGPLTFDRGPSQASRILQVGDLVYGSWCASTFMGYCSCTYHTFVIGRRPAPKEQDWYKRMKDRIDGALSEIKPGKTTADAARHFLPASTWGYAEECEVLASEIAHGIGLAGGRASYDMPIVNRQWSPRFPQVFEEGMCLAIECREGEHRVGGVRLEDMLVVTNNGAELITHFPRDEILVAPR
jgi:Xaa-Pro dipeptidase